MARYTFVDMSPRLLPVDLEAQLVPGTFSNAVHHLFDALDSQRFRSNRLLRQVGRLFKTVLEMFSKFPRLRGSH